MGVSARLFLGVLTAGKPKGPPFAGGPNPRKEKAIHVKLQGHHF